MYLLGAPGCGWGPRRQRGHRSGNVFCVGKEERNSASVTPGALWGESRLAKMAYSGSLASRFVNNDYVTAEIIYSTAHMRHKVLAWSRATLCCRGIRAPPRKWQHYCFITAVSIGPAMRGENIECLLPLLLLCHRRE